MMDQLLLAQAERYPHLQCQDCIKALYQAEWGCEHLLKDVEGIRSYLAREWEATPANAAMPLTEPLGDNFCRLHIAAAKAQGLDEETLFRLFLRSAAVRVGDAAHFQAALDGIQALAGKGELPFSGVEAAKRLEEYRAQGCPSLHHSEVFRQHYHPAYRVISAQWIQLLPILLRIDALCREKEPVLVAIEGCCASGKTTLAARLGALYGAPVLHMDDFFLQPHQRTPERLAQPGGNVDAERFLEEVLTPLMRHEAFGYRPYDCSTQSLQEKVYVEAAPLVFVEGSYSLHPMLAHAYDLKIFMQIDPALQQERILRRNGEEMLKRFISTWIPLENRYFEATDVQSRCDMTVSNACASLF